MFHLVSNETSIQGFGAVVVELMEEKASVYEDKTSNPPNRNSEDFITSQGNCHPAEQ
jgi:hypothetical protein